MARHNGGYGDDGQLTDVQRAVLLRAMSTPSLIRSLEQVQRQSRSIAKQVNGSLGRTLATQLEPVLRASRIQVAESLRPLIEQQLLATQQVMKPVLAQIAAQQQELAGSLAVPLLAANAQKQARMAETLASPELIAALRRIGEVASARLDFPDTDGIDRLSRLIDSGEIDTTTLETAESGVGSDMNMAAAIDEAVEVLARERPWMSRKRARQIIVVWVWLMWAATLVAITVVAPPIIGAIASAAGLPSTPQVAKKAGEKFDERFPPECEPNNA